jgi:hypothetical protein
MLTRVRSMPRSARSLWVLELVWFSAKSRTAQADANPSAALKRIRTAEEAMQVVENDWGTAVPQSFSEICGDVGAESEEEQRPEAHPWPN